MLQAVGLAVVCALGVGVAAAATAVSLNRDSAGDAEPVPSSSGSAPPRRATLSIIGEGYADARSVITGDDYWATRVAAGLPANVSLHVGSSVSDDDAALHDEAEGAAAGSDAIVVMASPGDVEETRSSTIERITDAFAVAGSSSPGAALVLVGPLVPQGIDSADHRADLRAAAKQAGARYADPVSGEWLQASERDAFLAGEPSSTGQRLFAQRLVGTIKRALSDRSLTVATPLVRGGR